MNPARHLTAATDHTAAPATADTAMPAGFEAAFSALCAEHQVTAAAVTVTAVEGRCLTFTTIGDPILCQMIDQSVRRHVPPSAITGRGG